MKLLKKGFHLSGSTMVFHPDSRVRRCHQSGSRNSDLNKDIEQVSCKVCTIKTACVL